MGDRYQDRELVFAGEAGGLINPSNLRQRSFASLLQRAGLPQITFHDLRHTCAPAQLVSFLFFPANLQWVILLEEVLQFARLLFEGALPLVRAAFALLFLIPG
jgi:integrase